VFCQNHCIQLKRSYVPGTNFVHRFSKFDGHVPW